MKKVLFVATVTKHINAFHIPYLKWFKEHGYEVHVASNGEETIECCDKHFNLNFARFPFKFQNWKAYKELKKIIKDNQYEIIHCHTPVGGVIARLAARKARKKYHTKVIYTAHGFHFYKGAPILNWAIYYPIEKWLSKYTDTIITINEEDYQIARRKFATKQIKLVHGVGINTKKFDINMSEEEKENYRTQIGINKDDFVIISIGELNKNKNQIMQIRAVKEIIKDYHNVKLLIVGEGNKRKTLEEEIENYNLQNNIKLLGYRRDVPELLKIANLTISTSLREGLPVNIMESLVSGVPVIGTNCRGTNDIIQNEDNGLIVEDINDLIIKLKECLNRKFEAKLDESFLLENVMKIMEEIYLDKSKKIVFNAMSLKKGGAERVITNLANYLVKTNDITIVTVLNDEIQYDVNGNINIKTLNAKKIKINTLTKILSKVSLLKILKLRKILKQEKPDIIVSFLPEPSFRILFVKKITRKFKNIPIIVSVRNDPVIEYKNSLYNYLMKKLYPLANGFVFQTEEAASYFKNIIKCENKVIVNPVSDEFVRERFMGEREKRIVTVGRLQPQKNQKLLIEAFNEVHQKHPEYILEIYGQGELKDDLEKLVSQLELNSNVKFKGQSDNITNDIYKARCFVLSSNYEGMPNALLEAFVLGVPCISTNCPCGGPKKIINNNVSGLLIETNNKIQLADAINRVIENDDLADKLSINANKSRELYRNEDICKQWEEFINKIGENYG